MAAGLSESARTRSWIVSALCAGRWTIPLAALARIDPRILSVFADKLIALAAPPGLLDNGLSYIRVMRPA